MNLGVVSYCLNVQDLGKSLDFYRSLGFEDYSIHVDNNYAILKYRNSYLGLFEGHISENMINFRGGNIPGIHRMISELGIPTTINQLNSDGSGDFFVYDPDGNCLYFDTTPEELEE